MTSANLSGGFNQGVIDVKGDRCSAVRVAWEKDIGSGQNMRAPMKHQSVFGLILYIINLVYR